MTTITIEKSKLVIGGALILTFIVGIGIGACIGAHHGYRHGRSYGYNGNVQYGRSFDRSGAMMMRYVPQNQIQGNFGPQQGVVHMRGVQILNATGTDSY